MRSASLIVVMLGASMLAPRAAHACAYGGGPVVGYAERSGVTVGWELSAAVWCTPLAHVVAGGSYRLTPGDGPVMHHYVAWEPWLVVGGTVGMAVDDALRVTGVVGAWEATPVLVDGGPPPDAIYGTPSPAWMITFAVGLRTLGYGLEIYFTPKLQWVERHDYFT